RYVPTREAFGNSALLLGLAARLCAPKQLLTPERGDLARAAAFGANLLAERKPALHSAGRLADRAIRIDGLNAYWHRPEYSAKYVRRERCESWHSRHCAFAG